MTQKILKVYKIRNKETGLFSKGGNSHCNIWTKEGKSWSNIGHVKSHLNQFINYSGHKCADYPYDNAEIVEIEIYYNMCSTQAVNEMVQIIMDKKEQERQRWEEHNRKQKENQERKQLEELKKKYEV